VSSEGIRPDGRIFRRYKRAQRARRKNLTAGRTPPGADLDSRSGGRTILRLVKGATAPVMPATAGTNARQGSTEIRTGVTGSDAAPTEDPNC
jgi:hypothetical protein